MTDDRRPPTEKFILRLPSRIAVLRLLPHAIILVAFLLRAYRLADKNVWWDEGWSVWLSQKDLAWIALRTAADEHPPLHYWLLHFWNFIAGTDAFAGRFISLAFGVLTIALLYRIGKRVGGAWVGILAALFLAVARFHIWWSQDIKNYTPSIFLAFAAVWFGLTLIADCKLQIADSSTRRSSLAIRYSLFAYALCAALALWTHYLAALILLALNLYALILFARPKQLITDHRSLITWILANALAAAFFLPWFILYLQNAAAWSAAPAFDFGLFLQVAVTVLPLGVTTDIENYAWMTLGFSLLIALGIAPVISKQSTVSSKQLSVNSKQLLVNSKLGLFTVHRSLFTLIILLPPLLIYLLSLTPVSFFAPKIQARYLLVLLPAYTILLALGIALLRRFSLWLAIAATLFVLGASAFVLNDYYGDRRLRDEYATLANTINSFARQGDLVLLNTDQEWPAFLYYLRYPVDWLGVPNGKPMNADDADTLVRRTSNRNAAVWLVAIPDALATDPQRWLESRLARELPKRFEQTFGDKRLVLFARDERDLAQVARENFAPQYPRTAQIDSTLTLLGFDLPVREARVGDTLRIVTYWRATNTSAAEIGIRGKSLAQAQGTRIEAGERIRVQTDFVIPPMSADELALSARGIELARVRVEPRARITRKVVLMAPYPRDVRFGDAIRLAGYDLAQTKFRAGASVPLTLYWRADRPIDKSYTVFVHLVGEQFNPAQNNPLWGQVDRVPRIPTTAWLPGENVLEAYSIRIDANAPPGKYAIVAGMYDAATGGRLPVDGGGDSIIIAEIEIQ